MLYISFILTFIGLVGFTCFFVYSRRGLWRKPMPGVFAILIVCCAVVMLVVSLAHFLNKDFAPWALLVVQACFGVTMGAGAYVRYRREAKTA